VMPDTGRNEAQIVADRLRRRLADAPIPIPGRDARVEVTMSMGCCVEIADKGLSAQALVDSMIDRADRALYAAKEAGRNRVALAAASDTD